MAVHWERWQGLTGFLRVAEVLHCMQLRPPGSCPSWLCAGVFAQTFRRLHARGIRPGILYPAVSIPAAEELQEAKASWREGLPPELALFVGGGPTFLSINRFERKKVGGRREQAWLLR